MPGWVPVSLPKVTKERGSAAQEDGKPALFTTPSFSEAANYASSPDKSLITGPNGQDLSVASQRGLYPGDQESPLNRD